MKKKIHKEKERQTEKEIKESNERKNKKVKTG